jgi:Fe-S oxidoreductase
MTKCPYVPPHAWNVDFPHLMLRAKAVKHAQGRVGRAEELLASTDVHGQFAGIPIVVEAVNKANSTPPVRKLLDRVLGVHPKAWMPALAQQRFRWGRAMNHTEFPAVAGERTPGKVAVFATCFVNYNEPQIGEDLIKLLDHNEIPYEIVEKERCCGMPKLELGDLPAVERAWAANVPMLARYAEAGWAILAPVPSCALMFKQELPLLFPDDAATRLVQDAVWDPFEYFVARHKDGLLKTDFNTALGSVSYHVPCHSRVQNMGRKTEEMFKLVGRAVELRLTTVERCSGHAGTYGVKTPTHPVAMKIGKPVFKAMAAPGPAFIASDCALAGHHIAQGIGESAPGTPAPVLAHPLTLLRIAYGL